MFSKIQDSLRFIVTVDASLGLGSAVRENGKKRGEIAKKKKQQQSASEATISFSARLSFILRLAPSTAGPGPRLC